MKKCLFLTVALTLSVFSLFTTSCDNNDEPNVSKPVATLAEVGEENSKTATAGKDMHLEGNLEAEGLIARIDVAVTSADGLTTVVAKSWTDGNTSVCATLLSTSTLTFPPRLLPVNMC